MSNDLKGTMSRRIRAARAFSGLSRKEMGAAIGKGESTYKAIEGGKRGVERHELLAFSDATGVPMWFLTNGWLAATPEELASIADDLPDEPLDD